TARELFDAIKQLKIRGAPAIGVAAAIGLYVCASRFEDVSPAGFAYSFKKTKEFINSARPTARNLFYATERMEKVIKNSHNCTVMQMISALEAESQKIFDEDIAVCRKIGENGAPLLFDGCTVLTHCNAGSLCAVEYGTALAPIYIATEQEKKIKVFADETRPLLQGARLTAFELCEKGIDTTVICDNMAASLMQSKKIDAVIVGCDRVAANGDFANKIGTLSLAVNAKHFGIPFYVAAPYSTIDFNTPSGAEIVVEERDGKEISEYWYSKRMTPNTAKEYNPAFDVTPNELVTSYITEKGILEHIKIDI
ncbi:MAG: S-methyl-5-thioribose-1-phosphate isomerase, partial [Clostridia bacterium]